MDNAFVIDVGMCDGADTAYYLHKRYRVLAIEADPLLSRRAQIRFEEAIGSGQLEILNAGIARDTGLLTFYRNLNNCGHSSFHPDLGRAGGHFEEVQVKCLSLRSVIEKYGVPHYLKIDIEGYDDLALSTLIPELSPKYISVELTHNATTLEMLEALGYKKFKLINQPFHTSSLGISESEIGWRVLRKLSRRFPLFRSGMMMLPHSWRPKTEWDVPFRPDGWDPCGCKSSGPFAEETHGPWLDLQQTKAIFEKVTRHEDYVWWDVLHGDRHCLSGTSTLTNADTRRHREFEP